jgi:D-aspartate ligase
VLEPGSYMRRRAAAAEDEPTPMVLGGGVNGLAVIRSLAQAGLRPVVVVEETRDVAAISRYATRVAVATFDGELFFEELLRLRRRMHREGVFICADDRPLLTLSHYHDRLAPYFRFQVPPHRLLSDLTSKDAFFRLAQRDGFPVPNTLLLRNFNDLSRLRVLRPPLCVKPNSRRRAYDARFKKAYRIETHAGARLLCERVLDVVG